MRPVRGDLRRIPAGSLSVIAQLPRAVRESILSLTPVVERMRHIRERRPRLPRRTRRPWLRYLLLIGPGIITACAGNDAGGIATYATARGELRLRPDLGDGHPHPDARRRAGDVRPDGRGHRQGADRPHPRGVLAPLDGIRHAGAC